MKNINNLTKRLHDHEFSINNKNTKNNRLNKMYRSIENRTETILPNLSPKKLKFKTKLIKGIILHLNTISKWWNNWRCKFDKRAQTKRVW